MAAGLPLRPARVIAGTHYPSDVLGGALVGLLVVFGVLTLPIRLRVEHVAEGLSAAWDRVVARLVRVLHVTEATR